LGLLSIVYTDSGRLLPLTTVGAGIDFIHIFRTVDFKDLHTRKRPRSHALPILIAERTKLSMAKRRTT
jgi:hypothetical protein